MNNIIIEILNEFNRKNINYAFLRNYNELFNNNIIKDIDIIVKDDDIINLFSNIEAVCVSNKCLFFIKNYRDHYSLVIKENENVIKIDIFKYIRIKIFDIYSIYILEKNHILKFVIDNIKINILIPHIENYILINHMLRKFKIEYKHKVEKFYSLPLNDKKDLLSILYKYRKKIKLYSVLNIIKYFRCYKNNRIIYLSGPDGAGKSTVLINLQNIFDKFDVRYFSIKSLQIITQVLTYFYKVIRKKGKGKILNNVGKLGISDIKRDRDNGKKIWKLRRIIGLIWGIFDILIFGNVFCLYFKFNNKYLIVEESPIDIFIKRHRPNFKIIINIFKNLFKKPIVNLVMKSDAEKIYNRKPELNINEIEEYYERLKYVLTEKYNPMYLNTDCALELTVKNLENIIIDINNNNIEKFNKKVI